MKTINSMSLEESLATLAAAIADRTRARMLCLLMDGRAYTATEITAAVDVIASTGSSHLAKLQEQNLITCVKQGRYRYFRLSGQEVAHLLETLMGFAGVEKPLVKSSTPKSLQFARTCYDHMAGDVAVKLHDCFFDRGWLHGDVDYVLTDVGRKEFSELGVDITPPLSRRQFACSCLDWSERKSHLGGALGAALLVSFEKQAWVQRRLDSRELVFTARGKRALLRHFQLHLS